MSKHYNLDAIVSRNAPAARAGRPGSEWRGLERGTGPQQWAQTDGDTAPCPGEFDRAVRPSLASRSLSNSARTGGACGTCLPPLSP